MAQKTERIGVIGWASRVLVTTAVVASVSTVHDVRAAESLNIRRSRVTGLASFVTADGGGLIPVQARARSGKVAPMDFLRQYQDLFGVSIPEKQLVLAGVDTDSLGQTHTTYRQVHRGVPVFGGMLKVHQNAIGQFFAANGDFFPVPVKLSLVPAIEAATARRLALATVPSRSPTVERFELVVVDPGWYGDPPRGARLAYHVVLTDPSVPLREAFFIDAHTGATLDRWSLIHKGRVRSIHNNLAGSDCCYSHALPGCGDTLCETTVCDYFAPECCTVSWDNDCAYLAANYCKVCALPGPLARGEGSPPAGVADVDIAYDYFGDIYDYYWRAFSHDSIDNAGMMMIATVNSYAPGCPNAYWNGYQMVFCTGTVTDDIAGHELTHGVTQFSASLMYQNQCGQLNESFSDVFGELIDLFNGDAAFAGPPGGTPSWPAHPTGPGLDEPNNLRTTCSTYDDGYQDGVRWLLGEDSYAFGGAIRDMWDPTCFGDPDRANSELQTCSVFDHGGVHGGSGTPSHAFAIATDGKDFNGYSVRGIGPIKTGAVWYRALTTYLTPTADFEDAYAAFNQAALDLVDTAPPDPRTGGPSDSIFTADDAAQVDQALRAVEMDTPGRCGRTIPVLDPSPPTECTPRTTIFLDRFETGAPGWTVSNQGAYGGPPPTPYNWVLTEAPSSSAFRFEPGTAWFCEDRNIGDCFMQDESAVHHLDSPLITLPSELTFPVLTFAHLVETERGWDGGNVKISVNGAPWEVIPPSAFYHNRYNEIPLICNVKYLNEPEQYNTNPLAGEPGFTGFGGGWGWSAVYLAGLVSGGDNVRFRFDFGKDGCSGYTGWYMDLFEIYDCNGIPDCNGNGLPDEEEMAGGARWEMILQQSPTFGGGTFSDKGAQLPGEPVVAAENFYVAHATTLTSIKIWGGYLPDAAEPPNVFSVLVHADEGGRPGEVQGFEFDVPSTQVQTGATAFGSAVWEITMTFTNPIPLDAGGYFVEIFNDTTAVDSDFLWASSEYLGTPGFAVALEVPGSTWYESGAFDLAIDVYGGMIGVDCNANGTPDDCEADCNENGYPDDCDVAGGTSPDCNSNGVPDECDPDCNGNDSPDDCDIAAGTSEDCNANGVPDECEPDTDCNSNGVQDICDIAGPTSNDCNGNTLPDECDLAEGTSADVNTNGVPDECDDCLVDEDCDDGTFCNGAETCAAGICRPGASPCPAGHFCLEAGQKCRQCNVDNDCDDGKFCNGAEACTSSGVCQQGTDPCTAGEVCDEANNECDECDDDGDCADEIFCNGVERCDATGKCQPGTPPCAADQVCVETVRACRECADDGHCQDGIFCNGQEVCDANGDCRAGSAPCAAGEFCDEVNDECDECFQADDCDDGDSCTRGACVDGVCRYTLLPGCGDEDQDGVIDREDACAATPAGGEVDSRGCACRQLDDDADLVNNCDDRCPNTAPGNTVDDDGCLLEASAEMQIPDEDYDGVPNDVDICPSTVPGSQVDEAGCPVDVAAPQTADSGKVSGRASRGVCGSAGMITWSWLVIGLAWLRARPVRHQIQR